MTDTNEPDGPVQKLCLERIEDQNGMTQDDLEEAFPQWSPDMIYDALKGLEEAGLISKRDNVLGLYVMAGDQDE